MSIMDGPSYTAPQNLEAEESVLGACLVGSQGTYFRVIETGLRGEDFYRLSHGIIFEAIGRLATEGIMPDAITVADELEKTASPDPERGKNSLEAVGGRTRIHEIANLVPTSANAPHYANIVRESALKRALIDATLATRDKAFDGASFDESLDVFERSMEAARQRSFVRSALHDSVTLAQRFAEKRLNPPSEEEDGVVAPWSFLSPFRRGSLETWAGYTSDGKTCGAIQAMAAACRSGARVGYASLEMTADEIVDRMIAQFGVPYGEALTGRISDRFQSVAAEAEATIAGWDFDVMDDEEVDPAKIRRWAVSGGYDLVIVDHLHRIEFADRFEIERTVRALRNMAKRLDIPVLLLAQLNRNSDKKNPFPRPTLNSLRETAVIEHESARVAFLYRERDEEHERLDSSEFVLAKNRFGKCGVRPLMFRGQKQTFAELSTLTAP